METTSNEGDETVQKDNQRLQATSPVYLLPNYIGKHHRQEILIRPEQNFECGQTSSADDLIELLCFSPSANLTGICPVVISSIYMQSMRVDFNTYRITSSINLI